MLIVVKLIYDTKLVNGIGIETETEWSKLTETLMWTVNTGWP